MKRTLLGVLLVLATSPMLAQQPVANNCMAVALNGEVFQRGDSIVARYIPGGCARAPLTLALSVQRYTGAEWVQVTGRTVRVNSVAPTVLFSASVPVEPSEWELGIYRLVATPLLDFSDPFFVYRETSVFFVGSRPSPWQSYDLPSEYGDAPFLLPARRASDGSLLATGRLGQTPQAQAWFFQFSDSGETVYHQTALAPVERTDWLHPVSVKLPNSFSLERPVYYHLVCAWTGAATNGLFYLPRVGWGI